MTTLTIRLDPKLETALAHVARSTGRTKSEIARDALRRQVAVARFRQLPSSSDATSSASSRRPFGRRCGSPPLARPRSWTL
jgi:hypothetical protein